MIRTGLLCLVLLLGSAVMPARASDLALGPGGNWRPDGCARPTAPELPPVDANSPADRLNAAIELHNAFVAAANAYMGCVAEQARIDQQLATTIIMRSAGELNNSMTRDIEESAARLPTVPRAPVVRP